VTIINTTLTGSVESHEIVGPETKNVLAGEDQHKFITQTEKQEEGNGDAMQFEAP
jgi:hypothetical protein